MKASSIPAKFPLAFAANAGTGFLRAIPTTSQIGITNGAASLNDGFPPVTFLPVGGGGTPPSGQDVNGIGLSLGAPSSANGTASQPIQLHPISAAGTSLTTALFGGVDGSFNINFAGTGTNPQLNMQGQSILQIAAGANRFINPNGQPALVATNSATALYSAGTTVMTAGATSLVINTTIAMPGLPASAGTVNGSICIDTSGNLYVKTTTGSCK